ncbi:hypothetical protein AcV7_009240 [Taiwanofungus camphoratus]|nr:hypothetical protein AcV7_009240 [Antrodia cinnamomea]
MASIWNVYGFCASCLIGIADKWAISEIFRETGTGTHGGGRKERLKGKLNRADGRGRRIGGWRSPRGLFGLGGASGLVIALSRACSSPYRTPSSPPRPQHTPTLPSALSSPPLCP